MASKRNVIVGAANLFLGPSWDGVTGTSPAPAISAGAAYSTTVGADSDWVNPGYTQEGLEVSNEPDFGDVEVDQLLDSARTFKQSMRFSVNTTLAEATLKNLLFAWGQKDSDLSGTATTDTGATLNVEGGSLGESPLERGLIAVGNGPEVTTGTAPNEVTKYSERTYHLFRVLSVESSAHAMRRNEATVFPVSFRCLPGDNGRYGVIRDRVPTAP